MSSEAIPPPTAEQTRNVETCRRVLTKVWGEGQLDICDEVFPEDFVRHDSDGTDAVGPGDYKALVAKTRKAFPDMRIEIHALLPSGNSVLFRTTMHGTHTGEFSGIGPTGAKIAAWSMAEVQFREDGMAVEAWVMSDYLGLTKSIVSAMSVWQLLKNGPTLWKQMRASGK